MADNSQTKTSSVHQANYQIKESEAPSKNHPQNSAAKTTSEKTKPVWESKTKKSSPPESNEQKSSSNQEHGFSPTNYQPPTLAELQSESRKRNLLVGGMAILLLGVFFFLFSWGFKKINHHRENVAQSTNTNPAPTKNSLSGRVVFATPAPASLEGSVEIYYRLAKSNHEFTNSGVSLSLTQESWQLSKLKNNAVYEIVAYLILDNQQVFKSEIITAQVPTQDLSINLPVDWQKYLVGGNVSGVIKINGFMPEGSKVVIVEDVPTSSGLTSEEAYSFLAPATEMSYTLTGVSANRTHLYTAELYNGAGERIGTSIEKIQASVDDNSINFTINSTATPTTYAGSGSEPLVTGQLEIKGPLRANSRILISGRIKDEGEFKAWQILTNLSDSKLNWQYSQLQPGIEHQVMASLQVNGETVSSSQIATITPPQKGVSLSLNTNYYLQAPNLPIQVEPCVLKGDAWETSIIIPQIDLAAQYWLEVGVANNKNDLYNRKHAAASGPLSIRVGNLSKGKKNFVRFSYAVCSGCHADSNFSPWSKNYTFVCN